ncbi:hypothetical protein GCM10011376_14490 [Nocardioides flavus (ex Wang et al. 2016)]|uniref:Protein-glutamine gamma-glutamyltransferase-like C-terminal domain-containing protein n=1 Tax=Nocardioides flavus (ex Wang et al. 2016) TaxID=2058780 RepID=A0ABQ3HJK5_9ACTN|nr:DUF4129 domain-containing protein [Nocardioides flavus (ex Wang et al. 2016)]GHE16839.1 hypothetical protein GCM10011376_14490 [Nocardioides flavus (ex Wang et al. 2016)]
MRGRGEWSPAVRATVAVAATCLLVVLAAWATRLGPDQVFTGPGPRPGTATATESCTPLPVRTLPDGTTEVDYPDDYALGSNYCDPPSGASLDEARDLVEDNPPPLWVRLLVWLGLSTLLVGAVALVLWLLLQVVRAVRSRSRREERQEVGFTVLDEPARVVEQVVRDAAEQDALLRDGDARNAIVATWHRFEVHGERAGVPRRASETSSEYALRILDLAEADSGPVSRLAELYREARFSDHAITEQHRSEALAALAAVRRSLGVRS